MRVAIVGYDVEGQASYRYFKAKRADITLFDESETPRAIPPNDVAVVSGSTALSQLKTMDFDIVMRTPGLSPHKLEGVKNVSSGTREFLRLCPAPIIGVTGTKGKGTTASLIHSILQQGGKTSWLVGNIGVPALDVIDKISPTDIVVYEMSSFQLWDVTSSPHTSVVLMIEPDHLDAHQNFADYVNAKANITRHQTGGDILVFNNKNDTSTHIAIQSIAQKIPYPDTQFAHVKDDFFYFDEQKLCSISHLLLPGKHNLENACAAISAVWSYVQDGDIIAKGLNNFKGLDHRLKFVREVDGISYYDDSIATTPGSALAAINSFDAPKTIILGGTDKGSDFSDLFSEISKQKVSRVITIGTLSGIIANALREKGYDTITELGMTDMTTIVKTAAEVTESGGVVIMSPACASFDMFKSYADRGEQFMAAVQQL